jgi:hypothetical protein
LVEHATENRGVAGSSPALATKNPAKQHYFGIDDGGVWYPFAGEIGHRPFDLRARPTESAMEIHE